MAASSKLSELCIWRSFHHSSFSLFVDSFSFFLFYFWFTLSPTHTFPFCQPVDTGGVLEASGTLALPGAVIFLIIIILQLGFFIIFFYSFRSVPYYLVYFSSRIFPSDHSVSLASFSIVLQILYSCSASDFFPRAFGTVSPVSFTDYLPLLSRLDYLILTIQCRLYSLQFGVLNSITNFTVVHICKVVIFTVVNYQS